MPSKGQIRDGLSAVQIAVIKHVGDGLTTKEIASALGRSPKTVAWHLSKIYRIMKMKSLSDLVKLAIGFGLTTLCVTLCAQGAPPVFLVPSNPPPVVQLAWTSAGFGLTNYNLYYGVGSLQYTNKTALGNVTNATVTLPARGVTFYFAVTANAQGLESGFSNEANYTPPNPPAPPTQKPLVVLVVQNAPSPAGPFIDAGMNWSVSPDGPQMFYRIALAKGMILATTTPPVPR